MLKKLLALTLALVGIFALSACKDDTSTADDLELLQAALEDLAISTTVTDDITLPTTGINGVTITWASDDEGVIATDGTVTRPTFTEGDADVTLTATLSLGDQEMVKTFDVTVTAATEKTATEIVTEGLTKVIQSWENPVTTNITLVQSVVVDGETLTVTWSTSDDTYLAADGTITRPASDAGNQSATLTASITYSGVTLTKDLSVTVKAEDPSTAYTSVSEVHANSSLDDVVEFTGVVSGLFDGGYFLSDGTYALSIYYGSYTSTLTDVAVGDEMTVKGSYAVYNTLYQISNLTEEARVSTGNAITMTTTTISIADLLALDAANLPLIHGAYYEITGTIELQGSYNNVYLVDGTDQVLISYYSLPSSLDALEAEVGKEVTIQVFYYTKHGTNGPMVAFDGGAADITINTLTDAAAYAADVSYLEGEVPSIAVGNIVLPTVGPNGTTFTNWASDTLAVFGNDGTFVSRDASTVTVTFTVTATKGTETGTITLEVLVPVNSTVTDVVGMDTGSYFEVTGVVTDESYYGYFIWDGTSYVFVYDDESFDLFAPGDEVTLLGSLGAYKDLLQVNPIGDVVVGSSSNTLPTPMASTVSALINQIVPFGTAVTVTGTISIEGSYNNVYITDVAGGKTMVYYRSNASELTSFENQIVTLTLVAYNNESVLFQGVAADVTTVTAYTDAYTAQAIADNVDLGDLDNVEASLTLPTTNTDPVATLVWASDNEAVVATDGTVAAVAGTDTVVVLTVTVTVGVETATQTYTVTVLDADGQQPVGVLDVIAATSGDTVLVQGVVSAKDYANHLFIQDTTTGKAIMVYKSFPDVNVGDEVVMRGVVTSYNSLVELDSSSYLVETVSTGNAVTAFTTLTMADITADYVGHMGMNVTLTNLTIADVDYDAKSGYVEITSGNATPILISKYDIPYYDILEVGDVIASVEAVVYVDYYSGVRLVITDIAPWTVEADLVTLSLADLSVASTVTEDITLPTSDDWGATISWASDNAALTSAGVVTRPALGEADVTVTLTATVTVGATTDTKVFTVTVQAIQPAAAPLFISEYIEGSGSNKVIEIYNPNAFDVVMSGYTLALYGNGSDTATTTLDLSSYTIKANSVFLVYNSGVAGDVLTAVNAVAADSKVDSTVCYYNGDDAVALVKDGTPIDVLGIIGQYGTNDAGGDWPDLTNHTIVRNPSITAGNTTWTTTEWTVLASDTATDLGSHTTN